MNIDEYWERYGAINEEFFRDGRVIGDGSYEDDAYYLDMAYDQLSDLIEELLDELETVLK